MNTPVFAAVSDFKNEILQNQIAVFCVFNLGVELHSVKFALLVGHGGNGRVGRAANGGKSMRQFHDQITVRHPDSGAGRQTTREFARAVIYHHYSWSVFGLLSCRDLAAQGFGH